jgi:DNA-binding SARP family transcriptional activator/tetratricopeptide (TPR) repeat protein
VLVVAAAGYGRTSALEASATRVVPASVLLAEPALLEGTGSLGVDDVQLLDEPEQRELAVLLGSARGRVRLALASRVPLPHEVRRLLPQPLFERGPRDLCLDLAEVAATLEEEYGVEDPAVASAVLEMTAGWPQLVHLAGDLAGRGTSADDLGSALCEPGGATAAWTDGHVVADLPDQVRSVLESVAHLELHHPEAWALLGHAREAADAAYAWLRRVGILGPTPDRDDVARLVPALARLLPQAPRRATGYADALAGWYLGHDLPLAAARTWAAAGAREHAARLVERRADRLLREGAAADVVTILGSWLDTRAPESWPDGQRLVLGHAQRLAGDSVSAVRTFAPLLSGGRVLDTRVAWRAAMTHYSLGEYAEALLLLDRASPADGPPTADDIEVDACRSHTLARLGRNDQAAQCAASAVVGARALGDDSALASAHLAAAFATTGDERELHLAQALGAATRCADHASRARVLLNQADALLTAARYTEAAAAAEGAVEAAERGSPPGRLVAALSNLGDALRHLGRYDEAQLQLSRSVSHARRHGLRRTSSGLVGLAELHAVRGRWHQAVAGYERAIEAARAVGEVQALVPALSGLARLLTREVPDSPGEPDLARARAAVAEATEQTTTEFAAYPACAAGWLNLVQGDHDSAAEHAAHAIALARAHGVVDAAAQALELVAASSRDGAGARPPLEEAEAVWAAGGAGPAADRVRVLLGRLPGAAQAHRLEARAAARRLRRLGVTSVAGQPVDQPLTTPAVRVRVVDGFEVLVCGVPVPLTAWRSRQARTLVKILAARRGCLLRRGEICELLWPDDDPARTGHRLSVLLSAVRGVLDPDRSWPPDQFVRGDHGGLALDLRHVELDADRLLLDAAHATDLLRAGHVEAAVDLLHDVASRHGDVLGDEPDASWADPLREEVRAATLGAVRQLARLRARHGEHDAASVLLLRLLTADPYDEQAHRALVRTLVRAGRHGEARRAFTRWTDAMRAIDVPPPDPRTQLVLTP